LNYRRRPSASSSSATLLALGTDTVHEAAAVIAQLDAIPRKWTHADLDAWVASYFALLDDHGSFAFAWTQAAHEDDELLRAGVQGHLELCRRMGAGLAALAGTKSANPTELGLVVFSMFERTWSYCQLYGGVIDQGTAQRSVADALASMLRCPPAR
jgi:hypothetical protein